MLIRRVLVIYGVRRLVNFVRRVTRFVDGRATVPRYSLYGVLFYRVHYQFLPRNSCLDRVIYALESSMTMLFAKVNQLGARRCRVYLTLIYLL